MRTVALPLVSVFGLLVACGLSQEDIANGDDPIAALSSTVESSRYGQKFWAEQRNSESEIWNEAMDVCAGSETADYPTCKIVREARFFTRPETTPIHPQTAPGFGDF